MKRTEPTVIYGRVRGKGQVTIPADVRERLGIREGDLVAMLQTDEGILISPQAVVGAKLLSRIAEELKKSGVSLEELRQNADAIREELYDERYGAPS